MPRLDQLEIISQNGAVAFHDLDPGNGITNIGRHPDNDIVIDSPSVADFHAILDHRQKPYQIMLLDLEGRATLGGQPLPANIACDVHNWDTIEIDGHAIVLLQDDSTAPLPGGPALLPGAIQPTPPGQRAPEAGAPSGAIGFGARLLMQPADQPDEVIIADLSQRDWTINCAQAATCQVTIINGGPLVATFNVSIEGLDPEWVMIAPPTVNLNEGERGIVMIGITPPRRSSSRAGAHYFSVRVTSPNYPDRLSERGATLTINPYYEFAVGDLSPRQQTVSWGKRTGRATLAIANQGNAEATFRLDGEDDQKGCAFGFQLSENANSLPASQAELPALPEANPPTFFARLKRRLVGQVDEPPGLSARQAELRVQPDVVAAVPIFITPLKRRVFGLRKHNYALTVTTTLLEEKQTPRSVFGMLAAAPLIGWWLLLLIVALVIGLIFWIFHPYIVTFVGTNGCTTDCSIEGGKSIGLSWTASPFVTLKLEQSVNSDGNFQVVAPVDGPAGAQNLVPLNTVTYRLTGDNFLSTLFPSLQAVSDPVIVVVKPVLPDIKEFETEGKRHTITLGESIRLFWRVANADNLLLNSNGIEQSVTPTDTGTLMVKPDTTTLYQLNAHNRFGPAVPPASLKLLVVTPTPTPAPKPVIVQFDVQPRAITEGQSINIVWEVTGAPNVKIVGIEGADKYPLKGGVSQSPKQKVVYQLIASNGLSGPENEVQSAPMEVDVQPAPPPPVAPVIVYFEPQDETVVLGGTKDLSWKVTGETTAIELSGSDINKSTGLQPEVDGFTMTPDKTTTYVLTACNGTLCATKSLKVTVTPAPTATPPAPAIDQFKARCVNGAEAGDTNCEVQVFATTTDTWEYSVPAGKTVQVYWQTRNAAQVTLIDSAGVTVATVEGQQSGLSTVGPLTKTETLNYTLKATNPGAKPEFVQHYIKFHLSAEVPPAPTDVSGTDSPTGPITITWKYPGPLLSKATGFRVYRYTVPNATWDEYFDVVPVAGTSTQHYEDNPTPTCGKQYYVVTLYNDLYGEQRESGTSLSSWYAVPCEG
jgi:hypothetical protein